MFANDEMVTITLPAGTLRHIAELAVGDVLDGPAYNAEAAESCLALLNLMADLGLTCVAHLCKQDLENIK